MICKDPELSEFGSDGNERVLRILQSFSITEVSPQDISFFFGVVTPMQRWSWCILLAQLIGRVDDSDRWRERERKKREGERKREIEKERKREME